MVKNDTLEESLDKSLKDIDSNLPIFTLSKVAELIGFSTSGLRNKIYKMIKANDEFSDLILKGRKKKGNGYLYSKSVISAMYGTKKEIKSETDSDNIDEKVDVEVTESGKDILDELFRDLRKYKVLSREEEIVLARKSQLGDNEAKNSLVCHNLRLVIKYARGYTGRGIELDDLIQEGTNGLIRAVEKFNPDRGFKFSTYGVWWIRQSLDRAVKDKSRNIRLPVHITEGYTKISKAKNELAIEFKREPTTEEICAYTGINESRYHHLLNFMKSTVSLDSELISENKLEEMLEDKSIDIEDNAVNSIIYPQLHKEMRELLTEREYMLISYRFGFITGENMTLREIAESKGFNLTPARISQIEKDAFKKLRESKLFQDLWQAYQE